eukprot:Amastigsp_a340853_7.p3 type:complete len:170 gc:universal Amastigsp_a340853_7:955-1464(+)
MQVLISCARPSAALRTKSASAKNGRAMETMSAQPSASTASATSGVLMRFVATSGTRTAPLSFFVTHANARRGTDVAIVGIRASCQPMPVLMIVAPAASTAAASSATSAKLEPSATRSSIERRYTTIKLGPTAARTALTTSTGKRMRFAYEPPQASVRLFVAFEMNSLMR